MAEIKAKLLKCWVKSRTKWLEQWCYVEDDTAYVFDYYHANVPTFRECLRNHECVPADSRALSFENPNEEFVEFYGVKDLYAYLMGNEGQKFYAVDQYGEDSYQMSCDFKNDLEGPFIFTYIPTGDVDCPWSHELYKHLDKVLGVRIYKEKA